MPPPWVFAVVGAALVVVAMLLWRQWHAARLSAERHAAMQAFAGRRQELAGEFLAAAAATGKPRGLHWKVCDLGHEVRFAVDSASGELLALVQATVSFEAVEGGAMEDVEAVGNLRTVTAIFIHRAGVWTTDGRAVFNLEPGEVLERYRDALRPASIASKGHE
jgi:hypothetical protein